MVLAGDECEHARHGTPTTTETNGSLWDQMLSVPLTNPTCGPHWKKMLVLNQYRAVEEARKDFDEVDGPGTGCIKDVLYIASINKGAELLT